MARLTTLTETDGESSYRLIISDEEAGDVQNPSTLIDYKVADYRFNNVTLKQGDNIRIEFNSASNGKISEGNAFAYARGRWRSVTILEPGSSFMRPTTIAK